MNCEDFILFYLFYFFLGGGGGGEGGGLLPLDAINRTYRFSESKISFRGGHSSPRYGVLTMLR